MITIIIIVVKISIDCGKIEERLLRIPYLYYYIRKYNNTLLTNIGYLFEKSLKTSFFNDILKMY